MNTTTNVLVACNKLIYINVTDRDDLDKIDRPLIDIKSDNGHVLVKRIEQDGVMVIFQHWLSAPKNKIEK